jgi:hypothetical protein
MKSLEAFAFDPKRCFQEVVELRRWLDRYPQLEERKQIQPFFRKRPHLAAFIACYSPSIIRFDRLAFQYPLFGDFTCDIAVGDSVKNAYCFVEFEDAGPNSLFVKQGTKATREWSPRFDHGYSQIIDWFYKLAELLLVDAFEGDFEQAVVVSHDSDLALPIQLVRQKFGLPVVVLFPCGGNRKPSYHLSQVATASPIIATAHLAAAQFPAALADTVGPFHKPPAW